MLQYRTSIETCFMFVCVFFTVLYSVIVKFLYTSPGYGCKCFVHPSIRIARLSLLFYLWSPYVIGRPYIFSSCLPAALREAQTCRYLVYSEANFEVFRPAGATRCTDGGEIWHGGGDRRSPPPCQISPPSVQRQGCRTPKIEIFTQIWPKSGI